jgi:hypothetical protein
MRQKSGAISGGPDRRLDLSAPSGAVAALRPLSAKARSRRGLGRSRSPANRCQRRRVSASPPTCALACLPCPSPALSHAEFLLARIGRREEQDLRAPPAARVIALRFVLHHASELQVIQPTLHALAVRAHEACSRLPRGRLTPAHHRRQPHDELLN